MAETLAEENGSRQESSEAFEHCSFEAWSKVVVAHIWRFPKLTGLPLETSSFSWDFYMKHMKRHPAGYQGKPPLTWRGPGATGLCSWEHLGGTSQDMITIFSHHFFPRLDHHGWSINKNRFIDEFFTTVNDVKVHSLYTKNWIKADIYLIIYMYMRDVHILSIFCDVEQRAR